MPRLLAASRFASTLPLWLALACGGSDDAAENADEAGPAGEAASVEGNGEAASAEGSGSATNDATASAGSTDADSTAGSTDADSTAGTTDAESGSSTDAGTSVSTENDMPPMDGPDTHSSVDTSDGVVETDTGLVGECFTACDCLQGLDCTDTLVCAPVPDNAWCCTNPGCPSGEPCENPDGTFDVCS